MLETKVVGHRWSARSSEVREFLARNQVPYRWYASDSPEGARLLEAAGCTDAHHLPLVLTPDGEKLVEPSNSELADRVGLTTTFAQDFYDLVVIGGGPAGLGAAVYGASEGLRTVLVERTATGGQAGQSSRIENYLGFPDGVSGAQLTERARRQAVRLGAELITTRDVVGLEVNGSARTVRFADGAALDAHTVILATGVSYRQHPAPGCADLTGRGVYYGSALTQAQACKNQDVYIVGGANSAGQAAAYLARKAKLGHHSRPGQVARVVDVLLPDPAVGRAEERPGTHLHRSRRGTRRRTTSSGSRCATPRPARPKPSTRVGCSCSSARRRARTGWTGRCCATATASSWPGPDLGADGLPPGWNLDRVPLHLETSVPGVFVAGDVRAESAKRVASAVGEGAMAVMLVHRYLEGM